MNRSLKYGDRAACILAGIDNSAKNASSELLDVVLSVSYSLSPTWVKKVSAGLHVTSARSAK
jgi:hypothetical protein